MRGGGGRGRGGGGGGGGGLTSPRPSTLESKLAQTKASWRKTKQTARAQQVMSDLP